MTTEAAMHTVTVHAAATTSVARAHRRTLRHVVAFTAAGVLSVGLLAVAIDSGSSTDSNTTPAGPPSSVDAPVRQAHVGSATPPAGPPSSDDVRASR
jgi:hypothetical protein